MILNLRNVIFSKKTIFGCFFVYILKKIVEQMISNRSFDGIVSLGTKTSDCF